MRGWHKPNFARRRPRPNPISRKLAENEGDLDVGRGTGRKLVKERVGRLHGDAARSRGRKPSLNMYKDLVILVLRITFLELNILISDEGTALQNKPIIGGEKSRNWRSRPFKVWSK